MEKITQYKTSGTCCRMIQVKTEGNIVTDVDFLGGCHGNLQGIKSLVKGMSMDEIISKLADIKCGDKPTSCPDQLAKCLKEIQTKVNA